MEDYIVVFLIAIFSDINSVYFLFMYFEQKKTTAPVIAKGKRLFS